MWTKDSNRMEYGVTLLDEWMKVPMAINYQRLSLRVEDIGSCSWHVRCFASVVVVVVVLSR